MYAALISQFLVTEAVWRGYNIPVNKFCKNWHIRELGSCLVGFIVVSINISENVVEHFYNIGITPQVKFDLTPTQLQTI